MLTNQQLSRDTLLANIPCYIEHGTADKGQKQLFDAIGLETLKALDSSRSETRVVNLLDGICDFYNKYSNDEISYEGAREYLKNILRQVDEFKQTKIIQVIENLEKTENYKQSSLQPQIDFISDQTFPEGDVFLSTSHLLEKSDDLNKKTLPFAHLAADTINEKLFIRPRAFAFYGLSNIDRNDSFTSQEERRSRGGSEDKSFGK